MDELVIRLSEVCGYTFQSDSLPLQALTHSSYAKSNHAPTGDNERLEFLGDAVLELTVSRHLFLAIPQKREGEMTRLRARFVREESLYRAAVHMGLPALLRLDASESKIGGREKPSIISDAYEAVIAAIYLDGGFSEAESFIKRTLLDVLTDAELMPVKDPKSLLQETVQASHKYTEVKYTLVDESGPDHMKLFQMRVTLDGLEFGTGLGKSKQIAGEAAAAAALEKLRKESCHET